MALPPPICLHDARASVLRSGGMENATLSSGGMNPLSGRARQFLLGSMATAAPALASPQFLEAGPPIAVTETIVGGGFEGAAAPVGDPACLGLVGEVAVPWEDNSCWDGNLGVQPISLQAGILYRLSAWMRADRPVTVSLALRKGGEPYTNYVHRTASVGSQWRRFGHRTIPARLFGMHSHDSDLAWPSSGVSIGSTRIWDADGPSGHQTGAQWAIVNPAPDVYHWSALDQHVARAMRTTTAFRVTAPTGHSKRVDSAHGIGPIAAAARPALGRRAVRAIIQSVNPGAGGLRNVAVVARSPNASGGMEPLSLRAGRSTRCTRSVR